MPDPRNWEEIETLAGALEKLTPDEVTTAVIHAFDAVDLMYIAVQVMDWAKDSIATQLEDKRILEERLTGLSSDEQG